MKLLEGLQEAAGPQANAEPLPSQGLLGGLAEAHTATRGDWAGAGGFARGFDQASDEAKPVLGVVSQVRDISAVALASQRVQEGSETPEDMELLRQWVVENSKEGVRQEDFGYRVGSMTAQGLGTIGEFLLTAGAGPALRKVGGKVIGEAAREAAEAAVKKSLVAKASKKVAETAFDIGAQTGAMELAGQAVSAAVGAEEGGGRITLSTWQRAMSNSQVLLGLDPEGQITPEVWGHTQDFVETLDEGLVDTLIEVTAERSGALLSKLPVVDRFRALYGGALATVMRKTGLSAPAAGALIRRGGFHGALGEIGEEYVGEAMRKTAPNLQESWGEAFQTSEHFAEMLVSFSLLGAGAAALEPGGKEIQDSPQAFELAQPEDSGAAPGPPLEADTGQQGKLSEGPSDAGERRPSHPQTPAGLQEEVADQAIERVQRVYPGLARAEVPEERQGEAEFLTRLVARESGADVIWADDGKGFEGMQAGEGVVVLPPRLLDNVPGAYGVIYHEMVHDLGSKGRALADKPQPSEEDLEQAQVLDDLIADLKSFDSEGFAESTADYMAGYAVQTGQVLRPELREEEGAAHRAEELGGLLHYLGTDKGQGWLKDTYTRDRTLFEKVADFVKRVLQRFGAAVTTTEEKALDDLNAALGTSYAPNDVEAARIIRDALSTIHPQMGRILPPSQRPTVEHPGRDALADEEGDTPASPPGPAPKRPRRGARRSLASDIQRLGGISLARSPQQATEWYERLSRKNTGKSWYPKGLLYSPKAKHGRGATVDDMAEMLRGEGWGGLTHDQILEHLEEELGHGRPLLHPEQRDRQIEDMAREAEEREAEELEAMEADWRARTDEELRRRGIDPDSDPPFAVPTNTAAFRRWFGDSKVVDENGKPLVVYHGRASGDPLTTPSGEMWFASNQDASDLYSGARRKFGGKMTPEGREFEPPGIYPHQTTDGAQRMDVYLRMENPLVVDLDGAHVHDRRAWAMREAKKQGRDGIIFRGGEDSLLGYDAPVWTDVYVVFDAASQVKSATGNRGTFDPESPDIRFAVPKGSKSLVALHNLSEENLLHAEEIGGLALPSISVRKMEHGPIEGFGEITLLAPKHLVDPEEGTPVFETDAWSARHPRVSYERNDRVAQEVVNELAPHLERAGLNSWTAFDNLRGENIGWGTGRDEAERAFTNRNTPWRIVFASAEGVPLRNLTRNGEPDYYRQSAIAARKTNDEAYERWWRGLLGRVYHSPYIRVGRRKVDYSLEAVVEAMRSARPAGKEDAMTFGAGKARAVSAKRFKSIEDIRKAAGSLVQDFSTYKEEVQDPLMAAYHEAVLDSYRWNNADRISFDGLDDSMKAIGDSLKRGAPTAQKLRRALARHDFVDPREEAIEAGLRLAEAIRSAPSEYFEAKPQRGVKLAEFSGALVPTKANRALEVLEAAGVPVTTYTHSQDKAKRLATAVRAAERRGDPDIRFAVRRSTTDIMSGKRSLEVERSKAGGRASVDDVAQAFAAWVDEKFGRIALDDYSRQARDKIAKAMYQELEYALQQDDSAIGWYGAKTSAAMGQVGRLYPEVLTDPESGMVFKAILAVTSNGQPVNQNFRATLDAYAKYRATGRIPAVGLGKAADVMKRTLVELQRSIDENGWEATRDFLLEVRTVGEFKKLGISVSNEQVSTEVRGAVAMFGPKLGSFFGNLYGYFDTITMDMWWARTFHRYTGNSVTWSAKFGESLERARRLLREGKADPGVVPKKELLANDATLLKWAKRRLREFELSGWQDRSPQNLAARTIVGGAPQNNVKPGGGKARNFMREVVDRVHSLRDRAGLPQIENADLQAVLWYYEKRLYALFGATDATSDPADYETAARDSVEEILGRDAERGGAAEGAGRVGAEAPESDAVRGSEEGAGVEEVTDRFAVPRQDQLGFFSGVEKAVLDSPQKSYHKAQVRPRLKKYGAKDEELDWMGLDEWLQGLPKGHKITDDELLEFVRENAVVVEEKVLGEPRSKKIALSEEERRAELESLPMEELIRESGLEWESSGDLDQDREDLIDGIIEDENLGYSGRGIDPSGEVDLTEPTSYDDYQLPGGEGYRELLLTLPLQQDSDRVEFLREKDRTPEEEAELEAWFERAERTPATYTSPHWDTDNILVSIRFNERTDAEGARVLFLEEIQSDWHQTGREKGYRDRTPKAIPRSPLPEYFIEDDPNIDPRWRFTLFYPTPAAATNTATHVAWGAGATVEELLADVRERSPELDVGIPPVVPEGTWRTPENEALLEAEGSTEKVPDAPFKTSWPTLAMKRMVRWAAEMGFDKIAWTTGAQQVDRYETQFRTSVAAMSWEPTVNGEAGSKDLDIATSQGLLELEVTDRGMVKAMQPELDGQTLEDIVGKEIARQILTEDSGTVEGEGLTIGGKGFTEFYDKRLVSTANKLGKKFGAKVGRAQIAERKYEPFTSEGVRVDDPFMDESGRLEVDPQDYYGITPKLLSEAVSVHSLPITPQMRESVMEHGMPRFAVPVRGRIGALKARREPLQLAAESQVAPDPARALVAAEAPGPEDNAALDELFLNWIADRQLSVEWAEKEAARKERELVKVMGRRSLGETLKETVSEEPSRRRVREMDQAMALYIDLGPNAQEQFNKYSQEDEEQGLVGFTETQRRIYNLSQNLPPDVRRIADTIRAENAERGRMLEEADVIRTVHENYTARLWEQEEGAKGAGYGKFTLNTARAKGRSLESILHGWALGKELRVKGAIGAQLLARKQTAQVLHDRALMETGKNAGILSPVQNEGWEEVEHPNFTQWVPVGQVELAQYKEGDVWGKNISMDEDGAIFRRQEMYAPKHLSRKLNNALGVSRLKGLSGIDALTRWNAQLKATILFTSLFHHQAFIRSWMFGSPAGGGVGKLAWRHAYKEGQRVIDQWTPEVQELVRGGLTLQRQRDIDEAAMQEKTAVGKLIDKVPMAREVRNAIVKMRDQQADFLFHRLGPQLKVMSALLEYRHLLHKHRRKLEAGKVTKAEIAALAADISNTDFGGLNLQREARNPTGQHIFRLLALAPDWTESNVRSMVNAFKGGLTGNAYRHLWARVVLRAGLATVLFNMLMAGMDDDERDPDGATFWTRQQRAWKEGKLRWLEVDVTPMYRALGGESPKRKYFSILGHFRDPIKFLLHPTRSAKHKASPLLSTLFEFASGTDWASRPFTSWRELLGLDEKGVYKTSRKNPDGTWKYRKGDPKGGRLAGETVSWQSESKKGVVQYGQMPSFAISQAKGYLPIQAQNLLGWLAGEMDAWDAVTTGLGLMTHTTREMDIDGRISGLKKQIRDAQSPEVKALLREELQHLVEWKRQHPAANK